MIKWWQHGKETAMVEWFHSRRQHPSTPEMAAIRADMSLYAHTGAYNSQWVIV